MGSVNFNIAKGRAAYWLELPASNDAILVIPLLAAGLEADSVLEKKTSFADLVSGTTDESPIGRKNIPVTTTVDQTLNRFVATCVDQVWTAPTGGALGAVVVCYWPDASVVDDTLLKPICKFDFVQALTGVDVPLYLTNFYQSV